MTNTTATPCVNTGIIPVFSYPFHVKRTMVERKALTVNYADLMTARRMMWNPLYLLAKFTSEETKRTELVESRIMWQPMYDFCGGVLVSSALTELHRPTTGQTSNGWGYEDNWKSLQWDSSYCPARTVEPVRKAHRASEWAKWEPRLLDIAEFVHSETGRFTRVQAKEIAEESMASALVGVAQRQARSGIFAADRSAAGRSKKTREIVERASGLMKFYVYDFGLRSYPEGGFEADVCQPESLVGSVTVEHHEGTEYTNPNSGARVSMMVSVGASRSPNYTAEMVPFPLPIREKLLDVELMSLLFPQIMFHTA